MRGGVVMGGGMGMGGGIGMGGGVGGDGVLSSLFHVGLLPLFLFLFSSPSFLVSCLVIYCCRHFLFSSFLILFPLSPSLSFLVLS